MKRRILTLALGLFMAAVLSGCGSLPRFTLNPQELYARPQLPATYTELSGLLDDVLASGAEYAAPTTGSNIQSVQLIDLTGDGQEEAVAYFRMPGAEKPLKLCVFAPNDDGFRMSNLIEASGSSIYSVAFNDLDADGLSEILVGWKATAELQVLEIYALQGTEHRTLLRTDYVRYAVLDLNGDGQQELVVLRADEEGDSVAEYYTRQEDGTYVQRSLAKVSMAMAELSLQGRLLTGKLRSGEPALFVTGVTVSQQMAVTDIYALREGEFVNLALDQATGVSQAVADFRSLYPSDINSDGVTEVPRPAPLASPLDEDPQAPAYSVMEWRQYDLDGDSFAADYTYHNLEDSWYLRLPESWTGRFYVNRTVSGGDAIVTFYARDTGQPFLRIYALTGTGRDGRSLWGGRFVLRRLSETIYAAELPEEGRGDLTPEEAEVRTGFDLIAKEWLSGVM